MDHLDHLAFILLKIFNEVQKMTIEVSALASQVAVNTASEAKAATALTTLVSQVKDLTDKLNAALANTGLSAEDKAALVSATSALAASATALAAATPA